MRSSLATPSLDLTVTAIPSESSITHIYATTDLADAFAITLPAGASSNPEQLARFIFEQQPKWINALLKLRDALVAGFGIKTSSELAKVGAEGSETRVGIFKIYASTPREIVLGEDDSHLDFRLSVFCEPALGTGERRLVLSTVVRCHNRVGRAYIFTIEPFHKLVVRASLRRAARVGWPLATTPVP